MVAQYFGIRQIMKISTRGWAKLWKEKAKLPFVGVLIEGIEIYLDVEDGLS